MSKLLNINIFCIWISIAPKVLSNPIIEDLSKIKINNAVVTFINPTKSIIDKIIKIFKSKSAIHWKRFSNLDFNVITSTSGGSLVYKLAAVSFCFFELFKKTSTEPTWSINHLLIILIWFKLPIIYKSSNSVKSEL